MYYLLPLTLCHFQELNLTEAAVNRLQTVGLRLCGVADQALPRLRGALPAGMLSFTDDRYQLVAEYILSD